MFEYGLRVQGTDGIHSVDHNGDCPLLVATKSKSVQVAERVLQEGAEVSQVNTYTGSS